MTPDAEKKAAERFQKLMKQECFEKALGAMSTALILQTLNMLREEGYHVTFPESPQGSLEFFGGIAVALQSRIEEEGESASYKLIIARAVAASLHDLQALLLAGVVKDKDPTELLAQLVIQGMYVGGVAEHLGLTKGGHFDEFGRLKFAEMQLKEKQRLAALRTNEVRTRPKAAALEEANRICKENPTLTNADLAEKVRRNLNLSTTQKSVGEWIAQWRREGLVPVRKTPGR